MSNLRNIYWYISKFRLIWFLLYYVLFNSNLVFFINIPVLFSSKSMVFQVSFLRKIWYSSPLLREKYGIPALLCSKNIVFWSIQSHNRRAQRLLFIDRTARSLLKLSMFNVQSSSSSSASHDRDRRVRWCRRRTAGYIRCIGYIGYTGY